MLDYVEEGFGLTLCHGMRRYVWLPLWVVPVQNTPHELEEADPRKGQNLGLQGSEGRSAQTGGNVMPADVVLRWHDLWRFSDFDRVPKSRWESGRLYHM